jgi:hypothetical protein
MKNPSLECVNQMAGRIDREIRWGGAVIVQNQMPVAVDAESELVISDVSNNTIIPLFAFFQAERNVIMAVDQG